MSILTAVIGSLLVITGLIVVVHWRDKNRLREPLISLLITIAGTFSGVYLAQHVAEGEIAAQERSQLKGVLELAKVEIALQINIGKRQLELPFGQRNLAECREPVVLAALLQNYLLQKYAGFSLVCLGGLQNEAMTLNHKVKAESDEIGQTTWLKVYLFNLKQIEYTIIKTSMIVDTNTTDAVGEFDKFNEEMNRSNNAAEIFDIGPKQ